MDKIEIQKINSELKARLSYESLKYLDSNSFKVYVIELFTWLNNLKNESLELSHIRNTMDKIFYDQSEYFEMDLLFEERFGYLTEEIISFCPGPHFWTDNFDIYMDTKWKKRFENKIIK